MAEDKIAIHEDSVTTEDAVATPVPGVARFVQSSAQLPESGVIQRKMPIVPAANPITELDAESETTSKVDPLAEYLSAPYAKAMANSSAEPVAEPVVIKNADPLGDYLASVNEEPADETKAEPIAEPVVIQNADPLGDYLASVNEEPADETKAEPLSEPVVIKNADPLGDYLAAANDELVPKRIPAPIAKPVSSEAHDVESQNLPTLCELANNPDQSQKAKIDALERKYSVDIVYQYYSPPMFERIRSDLQNGSLWARMQVERLHKVILADEDYQRIVVGRTFAELHARWVSLHRVGWILLVLNVLFSIPVLWDFAPFYLLLGCLYYRVLYKRARADCKGKGVYYLAGLLWFAFSLWQYNNIFMVIFSALTAFSLVWPYKMFSSIRHELVNLLLRDYNFFKFATGRPQVDVDRPPVTLIKQTDCALVAIKWDINPSPHLTDLQIDSPYPTVIGRNYDYYFSKFLSRLVYFLTSIGLALWAGPRLWLYAAILALVYSIVFCYICPSQQLIEFRRRRNESGALGDDSSTYRQWMIINWIWSFICMATIGFGIQMALPIVTPSVSAQLDELFPQWQSTLNSVLDLLKSALHRG